MSGIFEARGIYLGASHDDSSSLQDDENDTPPMEGIF
jgi:hypothetical protein